MVKVVVAVTTRVHIERFEHWDHVHTLGYRTHDGWIEDISGEKHQWRTVLCVHAFNSCAEARSTTNRFNIA